MCTGRPFLVTRNDILFYSTGWLFQKGLELLSLLTSTVGLDQGPWEEHQRTGILAGNGTKISQIQASIVSPVTSNYCRNIFDKDAVFWR